MLNLGFFLFFGKLDPWQTCLSISLLLLHSIERILAQCSQNRYTTNRPFLVLPFGHSGARGCNNSSIAVKEEYIYIAPFML